MGDLIEVFKIMKSSSNTDINVFFKESENDITRGHSKKPVWTEKSSFSQRVIDFWNAFPQETIDADSIDNF